MKYFEDSVIDKKIVYLATYKLTEEKIIRMGKQWDPQGANVWS